jgi:predicted nucleotide-binding protein
LKLNCFRGIKTVNRSRIFIGSSTEALPIAQGLKAHFNVSEFEVHVWNEDIFDLSNVTLPSLVQEIGRADFAIMVLTPDDKVTVRKKRTRAPRDNVLFETGLFMGAIKPERTIILHGSIAPPKLPSDLSGFTTLRYKEPANWQNFKTAAKWKPILVKESEQIKKHCKKLGRLRVTKSESSHGLVVHNFKEGSNEFCKFFARWYSQPGTLRIFCTDLDWVVPRRNQAIVNALLVKGRKLKIYLRDPGDDATAKKLPEAQLFKIKDSVKLVHRLSLLESEDGLSLIIRHTDRDRDKIVFAATNDYRNPYLVYLALDMLESCHE